MYRVNFIKYVDQEDVKSTLKEYNNLPDIRATHTGTLDDKEEIDITINYEAENPFQATLQGAKLAENEEAEIYSIYRTELIATEELFTN